MIVSKLSLSKETNEIRFMVNYGSPDFRGKGGMNVPFLKH